MHAVQQAAVNHNPAPEFEKFTLLELVQAVCDVTEDDAEVIATVRQMLHSGRVRLCGNFRNAPPEAFD